MAKDYRLKITHHNYQAGERTYIMRLSNEMAYFASNMTALDVSDLLHKDSAETVFAMQDAVDGAAARTVLQNVLNQIWIDTPAVTPQVTLVSDAPGGLKDFRLKITHRAWQAGEHTYVRRRGEQMIYFTANLTVLPASDLLHKDAAETGFALLDAVDGIAAVPILQNALNAIWADNPDQTPQVTVLATPTYQD